MFQRSILFALLMYSSTTLAQEIIVNSSQSFDSLSQSHLRSIFSMRSRTWPDNTPIKVFVLRADTDEHREFCLKVLEVLPYQLQRIWDVMLFSGTGTIPIEVKSEQEMLELVARTPGAIGYVHSLTEVPLNVKAIRIQ